ncbi:MAG: hypothetical protein ABI828_03925 [Actinomycetota bacterium]
MSVPARKADHASAPAPRQVPGRAPRRAPAPVVRPAARPVSERRRRPAFHPGFLFFSAAVVTAVVTGIVVLNVLLAQQAFQVRTLRQDISSLRGTKTDLTEHVAALSSPGRIQAWAMEHGMVTPPDVFVLAVPGNSGAAASGARP